MDLKEIILGVFCIPVGIYMIYKYWPYDSKKSLFKVKLFLSGLTIFIIGILVIFKMLLSL